MATRRRRRWLKGGTLAVACVAMAVSVRRSPRGDYVGTWVMNGGCGGPAVLVLNSDGTGTVSGGMGGGSSITWSVEGDHIVLVMTGKNSARQVTAKLSDDRKSLVISDGNQQVVLVRQ